MNAHTKQTTGQTNGNTQFHVGMHYASPQGYNATFQLLNESKKAIASISMFRTEGHTSIVRGLHAVDSLSTDEKREFLRQCEDQMKSFTTSAI